MRRRSGSLWRRFSWWSRRAEQEIITLSKDKWRWMSERNVEALAALFHDDAVFVHMGATMSKTQELGVVKGGSIQYKTVDIQTCR